MLQTWDSASSERSRLLATASRLPADRESSVGKIAVSHCQVERRAADEAAIAAVRIDRVVVHEPFADQAG